MNTRPCLFSLLAGIGAGAALALWQPLDAANDQTRARLMIDISAMAFPCLRASDADALAETHDLRADWRAPDVLELQQSGQLILLGVVYPRHTFSAAQGSSAAEDIICFEQPNERAGPGLSEVVRTRPNGIAPG